MALIRSLNLLQPKFKEKVEIFLASLDSLGISYFVNETLRTKETQYAYFSQGREPLETVNKLRVAAGLWLISEEENKRQVTWTVQSKHIDGLAIDIVPVIDGKVAWGAPKSVWKQIAEIGRGCDIEAGYFWPVKDMPHFQEKKL